MMENKELVELFVKCIFAVMSVIITSYAIPWLKAYIGEKNLQYLMAFIEKCVQAAEKLYLPEEWNTKKDYVMKLAICKCNELGLSMTEESLNALVEGFVKAVKG